MKISLMVLKTLLAAFGLWATAGVTTADAQGDAAVVYDVELVVFQHLSGTGTPEDWVLEEALAAASAATITADDEEPVVAATLPSTPEAGPVRESLPRERYRLNAIAAALQRSRSYRPIAHFGWSQPGTPLGATTATPLGDVLPAGPLTGRAALARGRYLHLTLDLAFAAEGQTTRYVLRQTRRMRSNERHYIDHPQFGVIALVTPQGR